MFVRVQYDRSRKRPRWRVQVVRNIRVGGKVKQQLLREIGTAYDADSKARLRAEGELHKLALSEQELNGHRPLFSSPTIAEIRGYADQQAAARWKDPQPPVSATACYHTGEQVSAAHLVWGELYSQIGWDQVLTTRCWAANRILKELVLARLENPQSKRKTVAEHQPLAAPELNLDRVYQTMDRLDEARITKIQQHWRQRAQQLLKAPITAVFYDTTTLAFESAREDLGELRRQGYSKDGKPHEVQVLFALIMTAEGLPLGYRVYPGNRYEGHTLIDAVQSLAQEGYAQAITVVADAGLCTRKNRALLRQLGHHYVLGRGVRKLPERLHPQLFDIDNYTPVSSPKQGPLKALELVEGENKIIVTHSPSRAHHDAEQRQKMLTKLRQQVGAKTATKTLIPKYQAKFLSVDNPSQVEINEEAVAKAAQFDGLQAIITDLNNPLPTATIIAKYKELWQIEYCFRTNKHDLKIRPIYHWKDRRIKAHLMICFMAFCCLQELRFRLRSRKVEHTLDELINQLNRHRLIIAKTEPPNEQRVVLTQKLNTKTKTILKVAGVNWPSHSFVLPSERKPRTTPNKTSPSKPQNEFYDLAKKTAHDRGN